MVKGKMGRPKIKIKKQPEIDLKLDLGCGPHPKDGFTGVDEMDFGQPIKHDLRKPWPWKDDSVSEVNCTHFVEHLAATDRIHFFNELYRVMKVGAKAAIVVPHWASTRAYGDLTHQWPPVVEMFWYYLDANWLRANAPHVPLKCNFQATWGYSIHPTWQVKNQEAQMFAITHYREAAQDMIATLTKV